MSSLLPNSTDGVHVTFEDAKEVVRAVQRGKEIDDDQYRIIFKGATKEQGLIDFKKLGKNAFSKFS